ncbi:MAG TPA: FHA domain-containing protein, partial [Gemmatimonadales bacterium]|nr:FHA domain-containing protein [Gemmatimonadales bacterium]
MFKLLSTTGEQSIDLQPGRVVVVGRAVTSDVPIYDPTISRRHAEVSLADGGVKVKDVGSSNGTFLNGARISEALAAENDVVTFGKVAFRVKQVSRPIRPQVVRQESSEFTGAKPAGGTIVRQLPVSVSGGVPAIVTATPSGVSHLKVTAKSLEELREKKLELLLEISKELSKQQELDRLLDKVVEFTFQVMNVDRVSIL